MAIVKYPPNTIWLGGGMTVVNDVAAGAAFNPGHLIERYNSSGTPLFRKHSTAGGAAAAIFGLNQSMLNKGVDDAYAIGDLVEAGIMAKGALVWALIGVLTVVQGDKLESAGNGTLRLLAAGIAIAIAAEGKVGASGETRVRVEIL
jgi:hypothetical protein